MMIYEKTHNPLQRAWMSNGEDEEVRHWSAKLESPPQQAKDVVKASGDLSRPREDAIKSRD